MSRTHAVAFAVLLAVNAVIGTVALTRTLHLGQTSHKASNALIAKRTAQLATFEASLKAQLAKKPPPLPKKPAPATVSAPATSAAAATAAPQVRYVRPAPIIVHKRRPGGGTEAEGSDWGARGGGDD
jgi:hypothetical protein